jgi:hypothetical protein
VSKVIAYTKPVIAEDKIVVFRLVVFWLAKFVRVSIDAVLLIQRGLEDLYDGCRDSSHVLPLHILLTGISNFLLFV